MGVPGWRYDDSADMVFFDRRVEPQQLFNYGNEKADCLSAPRHSFNDDILVGHEKGNCRCLYGRHATEAHGGDGVEDPFRQRWGQGFPRPQVFRGDFLRHYATRDIAPVLCDPPRWTCSSDGAVALSSSCRQKRKKKRILPSRTAYRRAPSPAQTCDRRTEHGGSRKGSRSRVKKKKELEKSSSPLARKGKEQKT